TADEKSAEHAETAEHVESTHRRTAFGRRHDIRDERHRRRRDECSADTDDDHQHSGEQVRRSEPDRDYHHAVEQRADDNGEKSPDTIRYRPDSVLEHGERDEKQRERDASLSGIDTERVTEIRDAR